MALVINTNISSLGAQRQLSGSGMTLDRATERLSSGLRVNSAKDDAAGLAIATRMTSQVRGLDQAVRNANDGVSLIQTAEGALQESTNILQRMRELAVQSSNGIYSDSDRKTLDAENKQLIAELDRIAKTTSFNGKNLLDGTLGKVDLQVGASQGQTITFDIKTMDSKSLGLGSTTSDLSGDRITTGSLADVGQGNIVINGVGLAAITNLGSSTAADTQLSEVLADINSKVTGVTAEGFNIVNASVAGTGLLAGTANLRLTLGSVDGGASTNYDISNTANMDELVAKINDATGGKIVAAKDESGKLTLSNTTGGDIGVTLSTTGTPGTAVAGAGLATLTGITDASSDGTETFKGSISLKSANGEPITITTGANGTEADLAILGFRRTEGAGQVVGGALNSTNQNAALANNDLKINGQDIGVVAANAGLQAKVDAINKFSDSTGVTAIANASKAFKTDATTTTTQVAGTDTKAITTAGTIKINGVDVTFAANDTTLQQVTKINAVKATTGVEASIDKDGHINLFSDGGVTIKDNQSSSFVADNGLAAALGVPVTPAAENQVRYVGTTAATNTAVTAGDVTINGVDIGAIGANAGAAAIQTAINAVSATTGVTATIATDAANLGKLVLTSKPGVGITWGGAAPGTFRTETGTTGVGTTLAVNNYSVAEAAQVSGAIEINGTAITLSALQNKDTVVANLNASSANTGVTASIDENGSLKLSSNSTITLKASGVNSFETARALGITFATDTIGGTDGVNDTLVLDPSIKLKSANATPISVEVSAAGAAATGLLNQNTSLASTVTGSAISNLSIATKAGASAALKSIDTALDTINDTRSQLGSINNRLDFTVANLTSISEKTTAARSRIVDADFAQETANLSRSTVLQQAATAMLAQANQRPQNVLSLLR